MPVIKGGVVVCSSRVHTCLARVKLVVANFFTLSKLTLMDSRFVRVSVAEPDDAEG